MHYFDPGGVGITVNLADPSQNTGNAAGDTYNGINTVIGTNYDDTLIGDGNINALEGGAGGDMLDRRRWSSTMRPTFMPNLGVIANLTDVTHTLNTGDAAGRQLQRHQGPDRLEFPRHAGRRRR